MPQVSVFSQRRSPGRLFFPCRNAGRLCLLCSDDLDAGAYVSYSLLFLHQPDCLQRFDPHDRPSPMQDVGYRGPTIVQARSSPFRNALDRDQFIAQGFEYLGGGR
jgi:hypothetical protein